MHRRLTPWSVLVLLFVSDILLVPPGMSAQAVVPRPNVAISRLPSLRWQVFPADFNKDGRTDLAGTQAVGFTGYAGPIEIRYGNGNGTFGPAVVLPGPGMFVLGVGDFNNDSRTDILGYHLERSDPADPANAVMIVPGTSSGFGAAIVVPGAAHPGEYRVAAVSDFDRDGNRDVAIAGVDDNLYVYPGNGDFTFDAPTILPNGALARAVVASDLNGDGSPDLALSADYGRVVDVYLNRGAFAFTHTSIPLAASGLGLTAWDINGDAKRDLIVGTGNFRFYENHWENSEINVLIGNGDGTFKPAVGFPTVPGPVAVVAGDFNRDGKVDVASANESNTYNARCDGGGMLWASVSILPGNGAGQLGPPASFSLGNSNTDPHSDIYRNVHGLRTSDLNGDGRTDLITSPGAVLLNSAAAGNRNPIANAGADQVNVVSAGGFSLFGSASDPDNDLLSFQWTNAQGEDIGRHPVACLHGEYTGTHTFTLTVSDNRGGIATDTVTYSFYDPHAVRPDVAVSNPRQDERVQFGRAYAIDYSTSSPNGISRVDIEFSNDLGASWAPIAECTNVPGTVRSCTWRSPGPLTEQGLVRVTATDPDGLQASATSGTFRIVSNASGPGGLPPGWRRGDVGAVAAAGTATYSNGTFTVSGSGADIWGTADEFHFVRRTVVGDFAVTARVLGVQNVHQWTKAGVMIRQNDLAGAAHASLFATPTTVKGIAFQRRTDAGGTSSHTFGPASTPPLWVKLTRQGERIVSYVRKQSSDAWTEVGAEQIPGLPVELQVGLAVSSHVDGRLATATFDNVSITPLHLFTSTDIGAVGIPGSSSGGADSVNVTLEGSGADIWGNADAFRYRYTEWWSDGTMTVRVRAIENTHAWAKAGIMFRESLDADAKHVTALVSPGKGLALQYRSGTGQASAQAANRIGTAPEWLRLTRKGNLFTASSSGDGVTWQPLGTVTVPMRSSVLVGLPVTSHNNAALATATFDDVTVVP